MEENDYQRVEKFVRFLKWLLHECWWENSSLWEFESKFLKAYDELQCWKEVKLCQNVFHHEKMVTDFQGQIPFSSFFFLGFESEEEWL